MRKQGVIVSEEQGNINWKDVKARGIQYAILRAGYGAGEIDLQFRRNAEGCVQEGIPFGVYWHSYAYTAEMAQCEALYCMETIEEYKLTYPVCYVFLEDSVRYMRSCLNKKENFKKAKYQGISCEEDRIGEMAYSFEVIVQKKKYQYFSYINYDMKRQQENYNNREYLYGQNRKNSLDTKNNLEREIGFLFLNHFEQSI